MSERVCNHDLRMGGEELPEVDIAIDGVTGLQRRLAYSPQDRDAIRQLHEDYLQIKREYATELERFKDGIICESSAHCCGDGICKQQKDEHAVPSHDTGHLFCQDSGSSRCRRERESTQLHRVDDVCNNNLQSDIDQLESGQRHRRESDWATDQGHDDSRQLTSALYSSSDMNITSPSRKIPSVICWKYRQGSCWRGESCWYAHDVAGDYQRDCSSHRLAGWHGGLRSRNSSYAKDGYTSDRADILKSRTESLKRREDDGNDCFTKKRHSESSRRYEDDGADCFTKKRCTGSLRGHEGDAYPEKGGKRIRISGTLHNCSHCNFEEQTCEVRKSNETDTQDSVVCKKKNGDESLDSSKSNDLVRRWRHKIFRVDSNCYSTESSDIMDQRSENCGVGISRRRMSRKINGYNDKQLGSKHSRKSKFRRVRLHKNVKSSSKLQPKDESPVFCRYFKNGYCRNGDRCMFSHGIESSKPLADMGEKKRSNTKQASEATREISIMKPSILDVDKIQCSTEIVKSSDQIKDQNSVCIDRCRSVKSTAGVSDITTKHGRTFSEKMSVQETNLKDRRPDIRKKKSGSQSSAHDGVLEKCTEISDVKKISPKLDMQKDRVNDENKICGNKEGEPDDGSANITMGHTDVTTSPAKQLDVGKKFSSDPSPPNLKNIVSEIPTGSVTSCVKVELTDETSKSRNVVDVPSASLKQDVCKGSDSEATSASCYASNNSCPPCPLNDVDDFLVAEISDNNGVNLDSQSRGLEVSGAQKDFFLNRFEKSSSLERLQFVKPVELHLGNQLELRKQNSCASVEEQDKRLNLDRSIGCNMDKNSCLCQNITCDTINCNEAGEKTVLETAMHDNLVDDDTICGNQLGKVDDGQKIDTSSVSCGVNHSEATSISTDQVEKEMLCPLTSNANSASSLKIQAIEEASYDDIALDMSLDHYICESLSLEHFTGNMEDEKASPLLDKNVVAMTAENPIQYSSEYLPLPTCDGFGESKPFIASFCGGLNPERTASASGEMAEETIVWYDLHNEGQTNISTNEQEKRHANFSSFELIDAGNTFMEENNPHYNKEPSPSLVDSDVIPAAESFDKSVHSLSACPNSETISVSSSIAFGQELAASIEANEKGSLVVGLPKEAHKFRCCEGHGMDSKGKEGNPVEEEKRKQVERSAVKLERIDAGSKFAETISHFNEQPNASLKERNVILTAESLDKYFDSSSMGQNSYMKPISSLSNASRGINFETNVPAKSWTVPSRPHSEKYDCLTPAHDKEEAPALGLTVPSATLQAHEKCSSIVYSPEEDQKLRCSESGDKEFKGKVGNQEEDDKLLLRLAVLEFAKEILDPLWKAGRIISKDIYKSITRKVVHKVSNSVHGVKVPRTKENVDHYLKHHKPRIAQLVLAYVNMYPVQL